MDYFTTWDEAKVYAVSCGIPYPFKIEYIDAENNPWAHPSLIGLYRLTFEYREPYGC
jgi:hypothetical protein